MKKKLVILESPFKGDVEKNIEYARKCMRDCFMRGEFPFASHLLYTQDGILDDTKQDERKLGIEAGLTWGSFAYKTVVYTDLGISEGMKEGIKKAKRESRQIEYRSLEVLGNQSPTSQTKSLRDFPNGEHNISLKESSKEDSQISSNDETSLNNNIKCNMNKSLHSEVQQDGS